MIRTSTNDDGLRRSIVLSAALHTIILLFLYFGLPIFYKPLPPHSMPVPFEIVEIADITNTRVQQPEEQTKAAQPQQQPPKPQSANQPPQPTPPQQQQPQPEQAKPQPQEQQAEALNVPKPQEKPKPPEAKPKPDMLASVLRDVSKLKPAEAPPTPDKAKPQEKTAEPKSMAPNLSNRLTISEEDALRRQIQQCWNMPVGARDAQNLIVEVTIDVNPDRTVQHAEVVDKLRMNSDPYYRAAAEAALRAVYNPRCSPLELPADKYEQWKTIDFNFDPRDML